MSYSKAHDDFAAVLASLSPLARRCVALLMKYIHQDGRVYLIYYAGQKKRRTFAQSLMRLTGATQSCISKAITDMFQVGVIESVDRFNVQFSRSLIRRDSHRFTERGYNIAPEIVEAYSGDLLFEIPKLHKGEDFMQPAVKKEFENLREDNKELKHEIRELRELLLKSLTGKLDQSTATQVERHLQLVKDHE